MLLPLAFEFRVDILMSDLHIIRMIRTNKYKKKGWKIELLEENENRGEPTYVASTGEIVRKA